MSDYVKGHVRTFTPIIVGYIATWLAANLDIIISDTTSLSISLAFGSALIAGYYAAIRGLGRKWPFFERLLGAQTQPTYGSSVSK